MTITSRFDRWVNDGPFRPADLGIYRILYALSALLVVPKITWLDSFPQFMFHAPPGPLQLFTAIPPHHMLVALELLRTASLILLGLGLWTRYASIATAVMLTLTYGLTFSVGKIDHVILIVLAPLVLAFANWGERYSLDAYRRTTPTPPQPQWPLRLLALLIGWGFFMAALTKAATGWLSLSVEASRAYFVIGYTTEGRTDWLAHWVAAHDIGAVWHLGDWMTVILEASMLIALPSWRAFRATLAVATIFHLGVLLVMDISFYSSVITYGAFVSWATIAGRAAQLPPIKAAVHIVQRLAGQFAGARGGFVLCLVWLALGTAGWFLMTSPAGSAPTGPIASVGIVVLGAVFGITYLTLQVSALFRTREPAVAPVEKSAGGSDN